MQEIEQQALMETVRELTREISALKLERNMYLIEKEQLQRQLQEKEEQHGTND